VGYGLLASAKVAKPDAFRPRAPRHQRRSPTTAPANSVADWQHRHLRAERTRRCDPRAVIADVSGWPYDGATQWLAAPLANPHLRAMVAAVVPSDYWAQDHYVGGALAQGLNLSWALRNAATHRPCLPIVGDLNCSDVRRMGMAPVDVIGPDDYDLDRDHDGKGCE
jgi:X-Pro dipeptidyl-peptidase (S15 family)